MLRAKAKRTVDDIEASIKRVWPNIRKALVPIKNDSDSAKRTEMLDAMIDKVGEDEAHPLAFICDSVGKLIEDYERKHYSIEESSPPEILKFLMTENSVKQKDLNHKIPQANLSAVLSGKRGLTLVQIGKISIFFRVSPAVFIPTSD